MAAEKKRVYIGGLSPAISLEDLRHKLARFGRVDNAYWAPSHAFAFVDFYADDKSFEKALLAFKGTVWKGCSLQIQLQQTPHYLEKLQKEWQAAALSQPTQESKKKRKRRNLLSRSHHAENMDLVTLDTAKSRKGWKIIDSPTPSLSASISKSRRQKYSRPVVSVNIRNPYTKKIVTCDPAKYKSNYLLFTSSSDDPTGVTKPIDKLTWEITHPESTSKLKHEDELHRIPKKHKVSSHAEILEKFKFQELDSNVSVITVDATETVDDLTKGVVDSWSSDEEDPGDPVDKVPSTTQDGLPEVDTTREKTKLLSILDSMFSSEPTDTQESRESGRESQESEDSDEEKEDGKQTVTTTTITSNAVINTNLRALVYGTSDQGSSTGFSLFTKLGQSSESVAEEVVDTAPTQAFSQGFKFSSLWNSDTSKTKDSNGDGDVEMDLDGGKGEKGEAMGFKFGTQMFFLHFGNEMLRSRSNYKPDIVFSRKSSLEDVNKAWEDKRKELTMEFKRKHKSVTKRKRKLM